MFVQNLIVTVAIIGARPTVTAATAVCIPIVPTVATTGSVRRGLTGEPIVATAATHIQLVLVCVIGVEAAAVVVVTPGVIATAGVTPTAGVGVSPSIIATAGVTPIVATAGITTTAVIAAVTAKKV